MAGRKRKVEDADDESSTSASTSESPPKQVKKKQKAAAKAAPKAAPKASKAVVKKADPKASKAVVKKAASKPPPKQVGKKLAAETETEEAAEVAKIRNRGMTAQRRLDSDDSLVGQSFKTVKVEDLQHRPREAAKKKGLTVKDEVLYCSACSEVIDYVQTGTYQAHNRSKKHTANLTAWKNTQDKLARIKASPQQTTLNLTKRGADASFEAKMDFVTAAAAGGLTRGQMGAMRVPFNKHTQTKLPKVCFTHQRL